MSDDDRLLGAAMSGLAALVVGLVIGVAFRPVRTTIGLENVIVLYVAVVAIAAASAGQLAGVSAATVSALAYNYFFTTPYETLKIDSFEQVVTVLLLFGAGVVTSVAIGVHDRVGRRHRDRAITRQMRALNAVAAVLEAEAVGRDVAGTAVREVKELLHARWVALLARDSAVPLAHAGEAPPGLTPDQLPPLDRTSGAGIGAGFHVPVRHLGVPDGALAVLPLQDRAPTPW
ncbi:MAG: DUF4118 domain-containing protein, partial [Egibacteraceae bacterium]